MTQLKAIVFILIGVAVVILVVQNHAALSTTVNFRMNPYFFQEKMTSDITLYEIVLVTYFLGVLSIGLYGIAERFRLKKKLDAKPSAPDKIGFVVPCPAITRN